MGLFGKTVPKTAGMELECDEEHYLLFYIVSGMAMIRTGLI